MTVTQLELILFQLPESERLRLAHLLLGSVLKKREAESPSQHDYELSIETAEWLTLAEPSLDFWNNEEDAKYDDL